MKFVIVKLRNSIATLSSCLTCSDNLEVYFASTLFYLRFLEPLSFDFNDGDSMSNVARFLDDGNSKLAAGVPWR